MSTYLTHKFARIISTVFVPPSFTIIIFSVFAFSLEADPNKIIATLLIAFVFGFIAPIVLFLILRKKGKLIDQDASLKEERTIPFFIAIGFYVLGLLLMIKFEINIISIAFWFCYITNTIITILINKYWKISAHAMGASGPFAALFFLYGWIAFVFFPIVILVGWSRIELKCHTAAQVILGVVFAFFSVYLQMYFITKYFIK